VTDEERAFLAARAAASGITATTAATAVELVTGRPPRSVEQFPGGWGAVPFWATAADSTELVVRVGLEERPYAVEATVLGIVRAAGIPAPEVAGVCRVDDRPVSVLVRVPASP
jgi:aminoglycoside phosphotransferase (APT) family kinase protein